MPGMATATGTDAALVVIGGVIAVAWADGMDKIDAGRSTDYGASWIEEDNVRDGPSVDVDNHGGELSMITNGSAGDGLLFVYSSDLGATWVDPGTPDASQAAGNLCHSGQNLVAIRLDQGDQDLIIRCSRKLGFDDWRGVSDDDVILAGQNLRLLQGLQDTQMCLVEEDVAANVLLAQNPPDL